MKTIALIGACLISLNMAAQPSIDTATIDTIIKDYFGKSAVKGIAVSITNGNKVIFNKGYGENLGAPITPETPLFIGSTSKVITGLAIALLKDQGKLNFEDRAAIYLPEWEVKLKAVTIKDLLHHHSGISQESGYKNALEYDGDLNSISFEAKKGEKGIYSSANMAILGEIIEVVSGQSYADFIQNTIFTPLKMGRSSVPSHTEYSNYHGYTMAYGLRVKTKQMAYGKYIVPAGYIVSTTEDLCKLNQMFLNKGNVEGNT